MTLNFEAVGDVNVNEARTSQALLRREAERGGEVGKGQTTKGPIYQDKEFEIYSNYKEK